MANLQAWSKLRGLQELGRTRYISEVNRESKGDEGDEEGLEDGGKEA